MFKTTGATLKGMIVALIVATGVTTAPNADALSKQERRALTGAIVGGLAGSLMSNGDPWATAGGALAGGAIGNATAKDRDHWREDGRRHDWERRERERRDWERRERERRERADWRNR